MDSDGGKGAGYRAFHMEFRDVIAFLVAAATFGLAFANLFLNNTADVPDWAIAVVSAVVAFYFGERRGAATAVQTLAENGRLDRRA